jgi:hypothetical protein
MTLPKVIKIHNFIGPRCWDDYLPFYRSSLGFFTTMANLIGIIRNRLVYPCFLILTSWSIQQVNELQIMLWVKMHAKIILHVFWLSWNVSFCLKYAYHLYTVYCTTKKAYSFFYFSFIFSFEKSAFHSFYYYRCTPLVILFEIHIHIRS